MDKLSGNGGFRRWVKQATTAREEEMGGGFDGVSRVLESGLVRSEELERGNDGKHAPAGVDTRVCTGKGNIDTCPQKDGPFQAVNSQKTMMDDIQTLNRGGGSVGLLRELSSTESERPNLNLEVLLEGVQVGPEPSGLIDRVAFNLGDSITQSIVRPNLLQTIHMNLGRGADISSKGKEIAVHKAHQTWKKGSSSKKSRRLLGGSSKQKGVVGSLEFQIGAIFRAAAAAVAFSLSSSQSQSRSRRRRLLQEAHITLKVGTILGL